MNGHIGLSAILMPQNQMRTALSTHHKPSLKQLIPNLLRLIRHRELHLNRGENHLLSRLNLFSMMMFFFKPKLHQILRRNQSSGRTQTMGRETQTGNVGIKITCHIFRIRNRL